MKRILLFLSIILSTSFAYSQSEAIDWQEVKVFEFNSRATPDSLDVVGEWAIKGKANSLEDLSDKTLERIKKKVAEHACSIVYVDVQKVFSPIKGKIYILGLNPKE